MTSKVQKENEENWRFKFVSDIDRETSQSFKVHVVDLNQVSRMCHLPWSVIYTSLVSFDVLLLSKANWIVSSDHRSINISVASLLQKQILPRFFDAISFFPRKVQDFGAPKLIFDPRAFAFVVSHKRNESEDENTSSFGTRAEKFAFTRQKSRGPCPILLARVPKFRSAVPKTNVV